MRVLFNCTTNRIGGAIQTAANFIAQAVDNDQLNWTIALSPEVYNQLETNTISKTSHFQVFKKSPAKSFNARRRLKKYENQVRPDLVYTMSGPAYVDFKSLHILGCSDPYVSHAGWEAFFCNGPFAGLKKIVRTMYKGKAFKNANFWIFQTISSRDGFLKRLRVPQKNTFIVPNALGMSFNSEKLINMSNYKNTRPVILIPSAPYPHKNLKIIPEVALRLIEIGINDFEFRLTLDRKSSAWQNIKDRAEKLFLTEKILNIGPFKVSEALKIYEQARVVFLPTLLETFSATYIEAMVSARPIVTSDRDFAKDICGDAAFYVDPKDATSCAEKLALCLQAGERVDSAVSRGNERVKNFPNIEERYQMIRRILKDVNEKNKIGKR